MTTQLLEMTAATSPDSDPGIAVGGATASSAFRTAVPMWRLGVVVATAVLVGAFSSGTSQLGSFTSIRRRSEEEEFSDTATSASETDAELFDEVRSLFDEGATEFFQDGMHSRFSLSLLSLLASRGNAALRAIAHYVHVGATKADVVSETLRWLAESGEPALANERWRLLRQTLRHPDPRVRDGAILGFAALDDPRALPILETARGGESIYELRRLIETVVEQLTQTAHVAAAENRKRKPVV